jgi:hypothetical protein
LAKGLGVVGEALANFKKTSELAAKAESITAVSVFI